MAKEKTLCDWSKRDFRDRWDELRELVARPKYACTKCGRAAAEKRVLCKASRLERAVDSAMD